MRPAREGISFIRDRAGITPWLAALAAGAVLTVLAFLLYYRTGGESEANVPLNWKGSELRLVGGRGVMAPTDPDGLEIQPFASSGIVLWTPPRQLAARLYGEMVWKIDGLDDRQSVQPVWRTVDGQLRRAVGVTPASVGRADLLAEPDWRDFVVAVGLFVPGLLPTPAMVRRFELRPAALTTGQWLDRLWEEWTTREDWSQRSINFAAGATPRPLTPPALMAAVWVGWSGFLYGGWVLAMGRRLRLAPFAALFLLGWLALDLRWQWELSQRLEWTEERFAGKDETGRRLADLDGELYRFLLDVRWRLPEKPARVFIISADPASFQVGRARYHLLPHNGAVFSRLPSSGEAREGDYVLILSPLAGVRYNRERRTLEWANGQLPAELLHAASPGALFRVRGG